VSARARILVEGPDDKNVCRHLFSHHGLEAEIKEKEGFSQLLGSLRVELRASDITHLAIIVDADVSLASRWQSLKGTLGNSQYQSIPPAPPPEGAVIVEPNLPILGIWIMPNNQTNGILEILLLNSSRKETYYGSKRRPMWRQFPSKTAALNRRTGPKQKSARGWHGSRNQA
jgi:hypothetical protein